MFFLRCILVLSLISVTIVGCERDALRASNSFALQPGDLLFQDLDSGPLCDAIERVTTGYQGMNFSHVGIAARNDAGDFVIVEAVSTGVEITRLETFLGRSLDTEHRPKVVVGRLKQPYRHLIPSAIRKAFALEGTPYDKMFAIHNGAYYCSELIYEIFLQANDNKPLFSLQPMTFRCPDTGQTPATWQQYFSKLGVSIPEGQPGINPGGISRSPVLAIIHRYGTASRSPPSQTG